ncbi:MAG: hypothetical protein IJZ47_02960 [Oscillospiraceae bacterium]|nr:hypothetical protein [Oscillospiraceae bacterium]
MEKKKQNKFFNIVFSVVIVVVAVIAAINLLNQVKPEVSIDGQTLSVGMTVQELTDAGFSVGISMKGSGGLDLDAQPQVPGEKYSSTSYYIFKDGEYTNVDFSVYNKSVNSCDFKDSRIYAFSFSSRLNFSDTEVSINGIDVGGMEKEEALLAFEKLGVKFDNDDKEEFLSGEYGFIIGKSGDYSFELETDDDKEVIESIRAKQRV